MFSKVSVFASLAAIVLVAAGCTTTQRQSGSIGLDVISGNEVSTFSVSCAAESRQRVEIDPATVINNRFLVEPLIEAEIVEQRKTGRGDKLKATGPAGQSFLDSNVQATHAGLDQKTLDLLFERCFIGEQ